jgi:hypothetical protein
MKVGAWLWTSLIATAWLLAASGAAWAQSAVAGVVKDTSGAVLPGVTVTASSPALIEKSKSTISDPSGQYRIVDLRPGTYEVSFELTRLSDRQARRHRAAGELHRQCQRRSAHRRR